LDLADEECPLVRIQPQGFLRFAKGIPAASDVTTGRLMGASAVALMHANPEFIADMKAAKAELAAAPPLSGVDCAAEAKALKIWSSPTAK
jgi:hypothetical protein